MTVTDPRAFLTALFDAAVAAADPLAGIRRHLPRQPKGRTIVIGAGKGSAQMAAALDSCWDGPLEGSSSHATALPLPASASKSSKPRTRSPIDQGSMPQRGCCVWCRG